MIVSMNILVISPPNLYSVERLKIEAEKQGCSLFALSAAELAKEDFQINLDKFDVLYVRNPYINSNADNVPGVIELAKKFQESGRAVVDKNVGDGLIAQGKWVDYQLLEQNGLPIPTTKKFEFGQEKKYRYPLVLKWQYGLKAKSVFLVKSYEDLAKLLPAHPVNEWLIQEFIPAECEYKVMTVGFSSVPVILKFNTAPAGFRIKYATGIPVDKNSVPEVGLLAEQATRILGRELGKVDILFSRGKFYILEVNRFPGLRPFETLTKYNLAADYIEYLKNSKPLQKAMFKV